VRALKRPGCCSSKPFEHDPELQMHVDVVPFSICCRVSCRSVSCMQALLPAQKQAWTSQWQHHSHVEDNSHTHQQLHTGILACALHSSAIATHVLHHQRPRAGLLDTYKYSKFLICFGNPSTSYVHYTGSSHFARTLPEHGGSVCSLTAVQTAI